MNILSLPIEHTYNIRHIRCTACGVKYPQNLAGSATAAGMYCINTYECLGLFLLLFHNSISKTMVI